MFYFKHIIIGFIAAGILFASVWAFSGNELLGGGFRTQRGPLLPPGTGQTISASSSYQDDLTVSGDLLASSTLQVSGLATFYNGLLSTASSTFRTGLAVNGVLNASSTILVRDFLRAVSVNEQYVELSRNAASSSLRANAGPIQFVAASSSFRFSGSDPGYNTTTIVVTSTGRGGAEFIFEDVDGAGCTRVYFNDGTLIEEMAATSTCQGVTSTFP